MTNAAGGPGTAFRGDIQGMRALAVLAVIAAHAGLGPFPGGYVGVDVFFVVSGFLITLLLLTSAEQDGGVSLTRFFSRRARRILPAASIVLVATVIGSLLWLSVLDAIEVAKDALWSALFVVNVRFSAQGVDYFSLEGAPSPLQHYWSLAVEEQFYLVWPLVVGAVFWAARRSGHGPASRRAVLLLVGAVVTIGVTSLLWSVYRTGEEPLSAYFSSLTRGWELAVGALMAMVVHAGRKLERQAAREIVGWGGFGAVVVACVAYDETMAFPGYAALLPVLGTAAMLYAGTSTADAAPTGLTRLLSVSPLRVVGDWSYSLYLWHWPLLVLPMVARGRDLTTGETLAAVVATFPLAYLTYRYVEEPFRSGTRLAAPRMALLLYPASLVMVLPLAAGSWALSDYRISERGNDPAITAEDFGEQGDPATALVRASVEAAEAGYPIPSDLSPDLLDLAADRADVGDCDYETSTRELCRLGDSDSDKVLVVTGDSHARAWIPALDLIAKESGYAAYYLVKPQCTAAFVDPGRTGSGEPWPECEEFHDWVVDQVEELDPDVMVVATSPPPSGVFTGDGDLVTARDEVADEMVAGFADMFDTYLPLADRLMLLADVPRLPTDPGACLAEPGAELDDCVFPPTPMSLMFRDLSIEAAEDVGIESVDPYAWLCSRRQCPLVIGSTIAYRDRGHISTVRAAELAEPLGIALGLIS